MAKVRNVPKSVQLAGRPAEVEAKLKEMAKLDKKAERQSSWLLALLIILLIAGFFMFTILPVVAIGCILLAIGSGILRWRVSKNDVEDRKLEVLQTLLAHLGPELKPGRGVEAELNFRGYWAANGQPWLQATMVLANNMTLRVSIVTNFVRKKKSKRKYTKITDKIVESVTVELRPAKDQRLPATTTIPVPRQHGPRLLSLARTKVAAGGASFVFSSRKIKRVEGRGVEQWSESLTAGTDVVLAVVSSYRLLCSVLAQQQAGAPCTTSPQ